jgi:hypothetical protein
MSPDVLARQGWLLDSLNETHPNNYKQQQAYKSIMEPIVNFKDADQDDIIQHKFHSIGGPGRTGKLALFKKLHAAYHKNSILITICTATSLAALSYEGATMAHSLFLYPVKDETDVDDQNLAGCSFNQERCDLLYAISVIFWDKFISNDPILMEAVFEEFKTRWDTPRYYVFVCAGDFAQACMDFVFQKSIYIHSIQFNPPILSCSILTDPSNCKSEQQTFDTGSTYFLKQQCLG